MSNNTRNESNELLSSDPLTVLQRELAELDLARVIQRLAERTGLAPSTLAAVAQDDASKWTRLAKGTETRPLTPERIENLLIGLPFEPDIPVAFDDAELEIWRQALVVAAQAHQAVRNLRSKRELDSEPLPEALWSRLETQLRQAFCKFYDETDGALPAMLPLIKSLTDSLAKRLPEVGEIAPAPARRPVRSVKGLAIPEEIKQEFDRMSAQPVTTSIKVVNTSSSRAHIVIEVHSRETGYVVHTEPFAIPADSSKIIQPNIPAGTFSACISSDQPVEAVPLFDLFLLPIPFRPRISEVVFFKVHIPKPALDFRVRKSHVNLKRGADDAPVLCPVPHTALDDRLIIKEDALMTLIKEHHLRFPVFLIVYLELDMKMSNPDLYKSATSLGVDINRLNLKAETLPKTVQIVW